MRAAKLIAVMLAVGSIYLEFSGGAFPGVAWIGVGLCGFAYFAPND